MLHWLCCKLSQTMSGAAGNGEELCLYGGKAVPPKAESRRGPRGAAESGGRRQHLLSLAHSIGPSHADVSFPLWFQLRRVRGEYKLLRPGYRLDIPSVPPSPSPSSPSARLSSRLRPHISRTRLYTHRNAPDTPISRAYSLINHVRHLRVLQLPPGEGEPLR